MKTSDNTRVSLFKGEKESHTSSTQNQDYVSINKRKEMQHKLRKNTMHFNPKMIGGKIGSILDV